MLSHWDIGIVYYWNITQTIVPIGVYNLELKIILNWGTIFLESRYNDNLIDT